MHFCVCSTAGGRKPELRYNKRWILFAESWVNCVKNTSRATDYPPLFIDTLCIVTVAYHHCNFWDGLHTLFFQHDFIANIRAHTLLCLYGCMKTHTRFAQWKRGKLSKQYDTIKLWLKKNDTPKHCQSYPDLRISMSSRQGLPWSLTDNKSYFWTTRPVLLFTEHPLLRSFGCNLFALFWLGGGWNQLPMRYSMNKTSVRDDASFCLVFWARRRRQLTCLQIQVRFLQSCVTLTKHSRLCVWTHIIPPCFAPFGMFVVPQ